MDLLTKRQVCTVLVQCLGRLRNAECCCADQEGVRSAGRFKRRDGNMTTMQPKSDSAGSHRWWPALLTAILVIGTLFTWWQAVRVDRNMRNDLLLETRIVARAVDIGHIKALSGTAADL